MGRSPAALVAFLAVFVAQPSSADAPEISSRLLGVYRARAADGAEACLSLAPRVVVFESREPDGEGGVRGCVARLEVRRVLGDRIELRDGDHAPVLEVTRARLRFGESWPVCAHAGAEGFVFDRASRQPPGPCYDD